MPTLYLNNAEGGTHGTTVTVSNSAVVLGNAFTAVAKGATSTLEYSNAHPAHGSLGFHFVNSSGEANYVTWVPPSDATASEAGHFYLYFGALPPGDEFIMQVRNTSNQGMMTVSLTSTGKLKVLDAPAAGIYTSTASLSVNTMYRIEARPVKGATTSTGEINFAFYLGDSATPIETMPTPTGRNTGLLDAASIRYGRASAHAQVWECWMDDLALQTGATAFVGPYTTPNAQPTNTLVASQYTAIEPGQTVTLTITDDDDVAVTSRTLRQVSGSPTVVPTGSGGSGSTRTIVAPYTLTGTTLRYGYQVSDGFIPANEAFVDLEVLEADWLMYVGSGTYVPIIWTMGS